MNNILFEFDRAALKKEGMVEIDKLVAEMKKYGNDTAVCIGHTDNVSTEAYNLRYPDLGGIGFGTFLVLLSQGIGNLGICFGMAEFQFSQVFE